MRYINLLCTYLLTFQWQVTFPDRSLLFRYAHICKVFRDVGCCWASSSRPSSAVNHQLSVIWLYHVRGVSATTDCIYLTCCGSYIVVCGFILLHNEWKEKMMAFTWAKFIRAQIHVGVCLSECVQQFVGHVLTSAVECIDAPVVNVRDTAATQRNMLVMTCDLKVWSYVITVTLHFICFYV